VVDPPGSQSAVYANDHGMEPIMRLGTDNANPETPDWRVLWAKSKPRHALWKHLLDAAAVSLALSHSMAAFGWNPAQTALIVGLHDIGKVDTFCRHSSAFAARSFHHP